jgi:ABC-type cobalt transport system, ATPase component
MSVIRTENLTYTYSQGTPFEKTAVKDVNIEIEEGELVGIIGHTGSGKSTLIQHLNGLIKPTSGKIFIDGVDIHDKDIKLRDVRFKVGLVFQYPEYQIFEETVYKDIAFGPTNMGLDKGEIDKRVRETAKLVGIDDSLLNKSPFELSGGQKRRVAIAGVMAMRPKVLILDEPTAGLDPRGREMILGQIKHYHEETGSTVLLVSHSMEDVARFAQKILVMNKGEVFCYDTPPAVFARADEIAAIGLSVPQITKVFSMLRSRGIDIRGDVYTIEFAMKTINEYLAAKGKAGEGNA